MRSTLCALVVSAGLFTVGTRPARADYIIYPIPGTPIGIVLEGDVSEVRAGRMLTFRHQYGALHLRLGYDLPADFIKRVPTSLERHRVALRKAQRESDAQARAAAIFTVGLNALKYGLLDEFYEAMQLTLEADPNHAQAKLILDRRKTLHDESPDNAKALNELQKLLKREMKVKHSPHFTLLYDTSDEHADKRLALLEQVYESFLMYFWGMGATERVHKPKERMRVVLFQQYDDFRAFADSLSPALKGAAGFWDPKRNVGVFFAFGTKEEFKQLKDVSDEAQRKYDEARRLGLRGDGIRDLRAMATTFNIISEVARESHDIEVVSHEATHQMAGNSGLFPPDIRVPSWVHEGLATFFEAPDDATWSGIGAVNRRRLRWFRGLEGDREHFANVDFVVGDEIFDLAITNAGTLHAYGQAWALTHFLITTRFDDMMKYYDVLAQLPPDMVFSPRILRRCFDRVFGADRSVLQLQWRVYMHSQKTDVEKVLGIRE